jgi:non-heme chloroperoxidase
MKREDVIMTAMPTLPQKTTRGTFVTNDGCTLSYVEAGVGKTVLMIPGWSQTAAGFAEQMALADTYHLIALDMRGHGESSKPNHGFRIHRLAKDVHEFMTARGLTDVTLLGIRWAAQ